VVRSPTTRKALAGLGDDALHLALAPVVVALAAVEGRYPQSGLFDMGRVAQSVMVSAHADGVGSCIAAFEPAENIAEARRLLGVPGSMHLDWALSLGYPAIRPDAPTEMAVGGGSPPGRMPMSAVVFWERFGEVSAPTR
jgi:nitroreductase